MCKEVRYVRREGAGGSEVCEEGGYVRREDVSIVLKLVYTWILRCST